jgi:hypothetical protein
MLEKSRSTLAELPMPVQGYILWDVARFPGVSVKTHHPCAIHPFSTDEGKPHTTPWGCGVGPRSPTYSETDLPQGQVPGYPPSADVPGSHSSLGKTKLLLVRRRESSLLLAYSCRSLAIKLTALFTLTRNVISSLAQFGNFARRS